MRRLLPLLVLLGLAGCVHRQVLLPAPGTMSPENERAAVSEQAGVKAVVVGRWSGYPSNLADLLTPVRVTLINKSGHPLRLRYQELTLAAPTGVTVAALPPFSVQRPGRMAIAPTYPYFGLWLAPPYWPYYPGIRHWYGPFAWNPGFYSSGYAYWEPSLPTRDMLLRALPEGVLADGGEITGYVYFPRVNADQGTTVTFGFELVDAESEAALGSLAVPLIVGED